MAATTAVAAGGAASLVGGAALGAVFGELLKAVLQMTNKAFMFNWTLKHLRSMLEAIAPVIKDIEQHNIALGHPKDLDRLMKQMEEGTRLVRKCSKIRSWNFLKRIYYHEQLVDLVNSLMMTFNTEMQAQSSRNLTETLLKVRRILSAVVNTTSPLPVDVSESDKIHDLRATQLAHNAFGAYSAEQLMEHLNMSESEIHDSTSSANDQVREDITSLTCEVGKLLCKIQYESMHSERASMTAPVSPNITVISPQYCVPHLVELAIERKVISNYKFNITDADGNIIFRLKKPHLLSLHKNYVLLNAAEKPIVTFRKKWRTIHDRWQVFSGESTEQNNLVFSVKRSFLIQVKTKLDVFLANNTKEEVCDFKVKRSLFGQSCAIYARESHDIVALMHKKHTFQSVLFGQDNFRVTVNPNVDYALIVALIMILDEIEN